MIKNEVLEYIKQNQVTTENEKVLSAEAKNLKDGIDLAKSIWIEILSLHKAPWLNGIYPNGLKALDDGIFLVIFKVCSDYFDDSFF